MIFCTDLDGCSNPRLMCVDNNTHHIADRLRRTRFPGFPVADRFDHFMQMLADKDNQRIKRLHTYVLVCPD